MPVAFVTLIVPEPVSCPVPEIMVEADGMNVPSTDKLLVTVNAPPTVAVPEGTAIFAAENDPELRIDAPLLSVIVPVDVKLPAPETESVPFTVIPPVFVVVPVMVTLL